MSSHDLNFGVKFHGPGQKCVPSIWELERHNGPHHILITYGLQLVLGMDITNWNNALI